MRLNNPRVYSHLVTLWIVLSIGGVGVGAVTWYRLNESFRAEYRSGRMRSALAYLRANLSMAQAAERGYVLTGDPGDLAPYAKAEAEYPTQLRELEDVAKEEPSLQPDIAQLRTEAEAELALLRKTIALRRDSGLGAAMALERTGEGNAAMARFRATLLRLARNPRAQFSETSRLGQQNLRRAWFATLAAGLFGIVAGILAFVIAQVALAKEQNERSMAEKALRAERSTQEKSSFLSNTSHEIRTPMNAILGFSELLVGELAPDSRSFNYARSIRDSSLSLLQFINDILDLSKLEAGMAELNLQPTDLHETMLFLQTIFTQQATRQGLEFAFELPPGLPKALEFDRTRLRQILVNLVGNALKFTERGRVAVQVEWSETSEADGAGQLVLAVVDTGVGIPLEQQESIFQPFTQVDPARHRELSGTGLGLSIVKRLTEHLGGTISLTSVVGEGSRFRLCFPRVAISSRLPVNRRVTANRVIDFNDFAPARLLVVDDHVANRDLFAALFARSHHDLEFARNGLEAIAAAQARRPDLIFMDIRMPEADGLTALNAIRRIPGCGRVPVLAVTASSLLKDEPRLRNLFAGYLRKPFTRHDLYQGMVDFLPRTGVAPGNGAAPAATAPLKSRAVPETPQHWADLVAALNQIIATEWPGIRDRGALNETKEFAQRLERLGHRAGCPPLCQYADAILHDAETYAVVKLEALIAGFPQLVGLVAARAATHPAPAEPT